MIIATGILIIIFYLYLLLLLILNVNDWFYKPKKKINKIK